MLNGISQYVRDAVTQINKVGVGNLRRYCKQFYPKSDFDRSLRIIRTVAQIGYTDASYVFGVSKQMMHQTIQKYYKIAKEVEQWQEKL